MIPPIPFRWDGEAMIPRHPRRADKVFVVGQDYMLVELEERSQASHSHQFAWVKEAWKTLPENLADAYPTPDHLRRRALIKAGYYHETLIDAGSNAAALRVASFARGEDQFAYVVVRGPLVVVRKAESQAMRAMGKERFQASKQAILEVISGLLGVEPEALKKAAA